jgi:S-adenosylmethionine-diacylglycerol 3-amino-3-carboxypropyl transferase
MIRKDPYYPRQRHDEERMKFGDWLSRKWFNLIHQNNLVYNTCWEDPRLDRQALQIGPDDTIMVITSAGCNVLDYVLQQPEHIFAVDMNPRQNALLELKIAGIRNLDHAIFWDLFGEGRLENYDQVYHLHLRHALSPSARLYWDKHIKWFSGHGKRPSFYFRGTSGTLAWFLNVYINRVARVRDGIEDLLNARSLEEQRAIYDARLARFLKKGFLRWAINRDATLSFLGVPRAQRFQIERTYPGGIVRYIAERIETVFTRLPLQDNYFWRVYLNGRYEPDCCPEYLKPDNFAQLKEGLVDRVTIRTSSILSFLNQHRDRITRFVLLDHMDWLSTIHHPILQQQWQALLEKAAPGARILWRSGGLKVDFVDPIPVTVNGRQQRLGDLLTYNHDLAATLHARDRVHTYGSFYIADLAL